MNSTHVIRALTPPVQLSPLWGDATLERAILEFGGKLSPLEAKHMFLKFLRVHMAVPIDPKVAGGRLKLLPDMGDLWVLPIFTRPELLLAYARKMQWQDESGNIHWVAMAGREVFARVDLHENVEVIINPEPKGVRIIRECLSRLAQGELPDVPTSLTPIPTRINAQHKAEYLGVPDLSPQLPNMLQPALEGMPEVNRAVFFRYRPADPELPQRLVLGVKLNCNPSPEIQRSLEVLRRWLASNSPSGEATDVVVLDYETEIALGSACRPCYRRAGY